jgi:hypothetical protein
MSFNDYIAETGMPTEKGKQLFAGLKEEVQYIIGQIEDPISELLTEQELDILGSVLMKELAEVIFAQKQEIAKLNMPDKSNPIWQMEDVEFESYMNNKYPNWSFFTSPLDPEDQKRYEPIVAKRLKEAFAKAAKEQRFDKHYMFLQDK